MIRIRSASGLGDSVYLRAIAEHFHRQGHQVVACTNYPDVFKFSPVTPEPFRRTDVDVVAHYVTGKARPGTTQWQDVCIAAGVTEPVPFTFPWFRGSTGLVERVRALAGDLPVVLVHGGRLPMNRRDGFGIKLVPEKRAFDAVLDGAASSCFLVAVGGHSTTPEDGGDCLFDLPCDYDLRGSTTIPELLDLFHACAGVVGQVSYAVPMAEVFDRPLLAVWSCEGLADREPYIRQITPQKVLSKDTSGYVIDSLDAPFLRERGRAFAEAIQAAEVCSL